MSNYKELEMMNNISKKWDCEVSYLELEEMGVKFIYVKNADKFFEYDAPDQFVAFVDKMANPIECEYIVYTDSYFEKLSLMEQTAILLHETGHIVSGIREDEVESEYLADMFVVEKLGFDALEKSLKASAKIVAENCERLNEMFNKSGIEGTLLNFLNNGFEERLNTVINGL